MKKFKDYPPIKRQIDRIKDSRITPVSTKKDPEELMKVLVAGTLSSVHTVNVHPSEGSLSDRTVVISVYLEMPVHPLMQTDTSQEKNIYT